MNQDVEFKEWLQNLKEGDEVAVMGGYKTATYAITKVKKVTPKGKIRTEYGDKLYDENGSETGDAWNKTSITQITPEIKEAILRSSLIKKLSDTDYTKLSINQLKDIYRIINTLND